MELSLLFYLTVIVSFDVQNDNKTEPKHQTQCHCLNVLNVALGS